VVPVIQPIELPQRGKMSAKERESIIAELSNKPDSNEKEIAAYMAGLK